jgi:hypothetical protein
MARSAAQIFLSLVLFATALLHPAMCVYGAPADIAVPQSHLAPRIDGTLDDPVWKDAAVVHLTHDLRNHGPATDETTAYILTDGTSVYVAIDAKQNVPIRATQHTNNVGLDIDDEVQIDLWPNGAAGFRYLFISTPAGTHYQVSTENPLYEPDWTSVGKTSRGGYVVTMKIPLAIMHGTGSGGWRVQFARLIPQTNDDYVWLWGPRQQNHNDVLYSGTLNGLPQLARLRATPRAGIYGLGAIASAPAGGSTSRAGADISLPVIAGTSFIATLHPDFSGVEQDQQTIAPTAFARQLNEVRPFFSQGANYYNASPYCEGCNTFSTELYTPSIPTPRDGYAIEGQRGALSYAAFDAIGINRTDSAQALNYISPNQQNIVNLQRSSVDRPGLKDDVTNVTLTHDNHVDFASYLRYSNDAGSNVLIANQAQRYEAGAVYYSPTASLGAAVRKIGAFFNPIDGLIEHPDAAGYDVNFSRQLLRPSGSAIKEIDVSGNIDRYSGGRGGPDQSDSTLGLGITTRNLLNVQASIGSSYVRLANGVFSPVNQPSLQWTYHYLTSTPTVLSFSRGRFGPGFLDTWTRSATARIGERGTLTLEDDNTDQFLDAGGRNTQWLERASFGYQGGANESLALGIRRVIGTAPLLATPVLFESGWNISAAFHRKLPHGELYVVYGDAAAFSTAPQFIVKYIRYVGADKGT